MSEWMEPRKPRPLQEAIDEVYRELCVRKRCFPRWVTEGRVSATDAQDRVDRLASAHAALCDLLGGPTGYPVTSSGDMTGAAAA